MTGDPQREVNCFLLISSSHLVSLYIHLPGCSMIQEACLFLVSCTFVFNLFSSSKTASKYLEGNCCVYPSRDLFYWNTHVDFSTSNQTPCSMQDSNHHVQLHATAPTVTGQTRLKEMKYHMDIQKNTRLLGPKQ